MIINRSSLGPLPGPETRADLDPMNVSLLFWEEDDNDPKKTFPLDIPPDPGDKPAPYGPSAAARPEDDLPGPSRRSRSRSRDKRDDDDQEVTLPLADPGGTTG